MKFVLLGDSYYNTALIGSATAVEVDGETHYFVQFIGGDKKEITEAEFNSVISE